MAIKLTLSLQEKGRPAVVSREEWARVSASPATNQLIRAGIIAVASSRDHVVIEPRTYVGEYDSPLLKISINAKSTRLEQEIKLRVSEWRRRVAVPQRRADADANQALHTVDALTELLLILLSEGIPWEYLPQLESTSSPRGRILFSSSIRQFFSKGITHKVVSRTSVRKFSDELAAAFDAVARKLKAVGPIDPIAVSKLIRSIQMFGDCSPPIAEQQAVVIFQKACAATERPALIRAAQFCISVLSGREPFEVSARFADGVAEFIDMEKLWEHALLILLDAESTRTDVRAKLHPYRGEDSRLFNDGGPNIDPDTAILADGFPIVVADAKYSVAKSASASDVYQLTCYVERLGASTGLLAYVSATPVESVNLIGTTASGAQLFAAFLTPETFLPNGNSFLRPVFSRLHASEVV